MLEATATTVEKLIPHSTRLLVLAEVLPDKTPGGVLLTEKSRKPTDLITWRGKIVALGPGWRHDDGTYTPLPWKIGELIAYYQGRMACPLKIDGEEYIILDEMDVVGVIEEDEDGGRYRGAVASEDE